MLRFRQLGIRLCFVGALAALLAAMMLLSPRRGFAQSKSERPPFDLTYVPADAAGVIAIRPNALFDDPATRPLARMANEMLTQLLQSVKLPTEPKLPLEEIEQIIGFIIQTPKGAPGTASQGLALAMIRATQDFDWGKIMRKLDPEPEEVHCGDLLYYNARLKSVIGPLKGGRVQYAIPDKRTLVIPQGRIFRAFREGKFRQPQQFAWGKDWKRVERDLFAVGFDDFYGQCSREEPIVLGEFQRLTSQWVTAITKGAASIVAGVDCRDEIDCHAVLTCKDRTAANRIKRNIQDFLKLESQIPEESLGAGSVATPGQLAVVPDSAMDDIPKEIQLMMSVYRDLGRHVRVTREGNTACVRTSAKISKADLAKVILFHAGVQPHEPASETRRK